MSSSPVTLTITTPARSQVRTVNGADILGDSSETCVLSVIAGHLSSTGRHRVAEVACPAGGLGRLYAAAPARQMINAGSAGG
jgi:hypothetical protein